MPALSSLRQKAIEAIGAALTEEDIEKLVMEAIRSLREQIPPPSDGLQGLAAVEVLQAMYESAQAGREIVLSATRDPIA